MLKWKKRRKEIDMRLRLCAFADEAAVELADQIQALQENNINLIELRNVGGKNIKDISEEEAKQYSEMLKENGIEVWAIGSPIGKIDIEGDFEKHLQDAKHIFKLAKIFGTDRIRIFSFFLKDYDKHENLALERLKILLAEAEQHGVRLFHENEKNIFGDAVERVLKLKNALPELGIVFDPANFIQCKEDIKDAISKLHGLTDYFHIKDIDKKTGEIVPAGYGDGKIESLVKGVERETVFTLEPHLTVFAGYANIDRSRLRTKFAFPGNKEAFDFAVLSFKQVLIKAGYQEKEGYWEK